MSERHVGAEDFLGLAETIAAEVGYEGGWVRQGAYDSEAILLGRESSIVPEELERLLCNDPATRWTPERFATACLILETTLVRLQASKEPDAVVATTHLVGDDPTVEPLPPMSGTEAPVVEPVIINAAAPEEGSDDAHELFVEEPIAAGKEVGQADFKRGVTRQLVGFLQGRVDMSDPRAKAVLAIANRSLLTKASGDLQPLKPVEQQSFARGLLKIIGIQNHDYTKKFNLEVTEARRLEQFLGVHFSRKGDGSYLLETKTPMTLQDIRQAAARGKKQPPDAAEGDLLRALQKVLQAELPTLGQAVTEFAGRHEQPSLKAVFGLEHKFTHDQVCQARDNYRAILLQYISDGAFKTVDQQARNVLFMLGGLRVVPNSAGKGVLVRVKFLPMRQVREQLKKTGLSEQQVDAAIARGVSALLESDEALKIA